MKISLVCTVRNEAANIDALIESMLAQTRRPDEIVINDCGSTDDTTARVQRWIDEGAPIRLVSGGFNISSGRNNAIRHAAGPIVASTDAGLTLAPDWLERLVAPLERGEAELVGGFSAPAPQSRFEVVLGATNYRAVEEIDGAGFLPAGQCVAFLREVWKAAGGYPEWLDHSEDLVFDRAALAAGYRSAFVPDAVIHFRPRESLRALFRQYFFYARGDGVAGLWPLRHVRFRHPGITVSMPARVTAKRRLPSLSPISFSPDAGKR